MRLAHFLTFGSSSPPVSHTSQRLTQNDCDLGQRKPFLISKLHSSDHLLAEAKHSIYGLYESAYSIGTIIYPDYICDFMDDYSYSISEVARYLLERAAILTKFPGLHSQFGLQNMTWYRYGCRTFVVAFVQARVPAFA